MKQFEVCLSYMDSFPVRSVRDDKGGLSCLVQNITRLVMARIMPF